MLILAIAAVLPGCASIISGTQQSVSVVARTPAQQEVVGARCSLSNTKGEWFVTTPGSVTVHRGYGVLTVACDHADWAGQLEAKSTTKAAAFGNIIFGGGIGVAVDVANGSAYDYPQLITVGMQAKAAPATGATSAAPAPLVAAAAMPSSAAAFVSQAPAPAPVSPPATRAPALGPSGEDAFTVEHLDEVRRCNAAPRATLTGKGPGMSSHAVTCSSGDVLAVRCEFGSCRVLR